MLERIIQKTRVKKDVNHFMLFTLGYGVQIVRGAVNFTNSVGTETCLQGVLLTWIYSCLHIRGSFRTGSYHPLTFWDRIAGYKIDYSSFVLLPLFFAFVIRCLNKFSFIFASIFHSLVKLGIIFLKDWNCDAAKMMSNKKVMINYQEYKIVNISRLIK